MVQSFCKALADFSEFLGGLQGFFDGKEVTMEEVEKYRSVAEPVIDNFGKEIGLVERYVLLKQGQESIGLSGVQNFGILMDGGGFEGSLSSENTDKYGQ